MAALLVFYLLLQGGPHNHTISGLACALKQASTSEFKAYQKQVWQSRACVRSHVEGGGCRSSSTRQARRRMRHVPPHAREYARDPRTPASAAAASWRPQKHTRTHASSWVPTLSLGLPLLLKP